VEIYGEKLYVSKKFVSCDPSPSTLYQSEVKRTAVALALRQGTITKCATNNTFITITTTGAIPKVTLKINCQGILFRNCYTWNGDLEEGINRIATTRFPADDGKKFNPDEYSVKKCQ
jgi:hypothetical protein